MTFLGWIDRIRSRCGREGAQTMAEYAVILGVITPAIIIAYGLLSGTIGNMLNSVASLF